MQIGNCWFDSQRQVLIEHNSQKSYQLSVNETRILSLLLKHKNQVVSNVALVNEMILEGDKELELTDIIHNLKQVLGKKYAPLIEAVADQGFLLHTHLVNTSYSLLDRPYKVISIIKYVLVIGFIVSLIFWISSIYDAPYTDQSVYIEPQQFYQDPQLELLFYPVNYQQYQQLKPHLLAFSKQIKQCKNSLWSKISVSVSSDTSFANILAFKEKQNKPIFHNIKIFEPDVDFKFISPSWLIEVGLCE